MDTNQLLVITHFFQKRSNEMQSYVINQVQVLAIFVPARFFFLTLPIISNSNEEANTFLLVVIHFLQIFALLHPTVLAI